MRLALAALLAAALQAQSPFGTFLGELVTPGGKLRLGVIITEGPKTELVSIDQGFSRIATPTTTIEGKTVKFANPTFNISFEGTLSEDGKTITGKFTQGLPFDLTLNRVAELPQPNRPQEPKGPLPYTAQNVTFPGGADGVKLAGTLTLPKSTAKSPAIVLVSGSGPQNRDEELLGHKPFLIWADALTRDGYIVLRYDDRGTAQSTGNFKGATTQDFALDATAAVTYLRTRKEVDPKRIVVMGHSEGGLIAPIVAAKDPTLAGIILLAGPGVTGEAILNKQIPDGGRAAGLNDAQIATQLEAIRKQADADPWMRFFWSYDPVPALKSVKTPVLALNGELDLQVNADINLQAIEAALKSGANPPHTIKKLPKLNHLFQTAQTGAAREYARIEETIAPAAINEVKLWLKTTLATK